MSHFFNILNHHHPIWFDNRSPCRVSYFWSVCWNKNCWIFQDSDIWLFGRVWSLSLYGRLPPISLLFTPSYRCSHHPPFSNLHFPTLVFLYILCFTFHVKPFYHLRWYCYWLLDDMIFKYSTLMAWLAETNKLNGLIHDKAFHDDIFCSIKYPCRYIFSFLISYHFLHNHPFTQHFQVQYRLSSRDKY